MDKHRGCFIMADYLVSCNSLEDRGGPQHDSVLVVGGIQIDNIIYIYIRCWKKRI